MGERFSLTDEGRLEYYLGVELEYKDQNTLVLHRRAYIKKLLTRFKMEHYNPQATPLDTNLNLSLKDCPDVVDPDVQEEYSELVGSLMYLYLWTRPDIGFAVTFLSRYFLQECVQRKVILLAYIRTAQNIADIMTKQSQGPQFRVHRDYSLGLIDTLEIHESNPAVVMVHKGNDRRNV